MATFRPGDPVQTRFGKGTVRELRNNGRVVVEVGERAMVLPASEISLIKEEVRRRPRPGGSKPVHAGEPHARPKARQGASELDLHGLTVEQALARFDAALNDALLDDLSELRVVHGRSGGRLRAALHRHLREIPSVRSFRLDPRNEGVTIVAL